MVILEDTKQQAGKHEIKNKWFEENGVRVIRQGLLVGDYIRANNGAISIDTKQTIQELIFDIVQDHERFTKEMQLAMDCDIKLIFVVENKENVKKMEDLFSWYNWRLKQSPRATTGKTLFKMLTTIKEKYQTDFIFCSPEESAEIIYNLLK